MIQADYFIPQIVSRNTYIKVIKRKEFLTSMYVEEEYNTIYFGKVEDIDLHLISSYDVIKVEPKNIEEHHSDKTATIYFNALEITVN